MLNKTVSHLLLIVRRMGELVLFSQSVVVECFVNVRDLYWPWLVFSSLIEDLQLLVNVQACAHRCTVTRHVDQLAYRRVLSRQVGYFFNSLEQRLKLNKIRWRQMATKSKNLYYIRSKV